MHVQVNNSIFYKCGRFRHWSNHKTRCPMLFNFVQNTARVLFAICLVSNFISKVMEQLNINVKYSTTRYLFVKIVMFF